MYISVKCLRKLPPTLFFSLYKTADLDTVSNDFEKSTKHAHKLLGFFCMKTFVYYGFQHKTVITVPMIAFLNSH